MPFYYLHDKKFKPKSIKDFKYLYYSSKKLLEFTNVISFYGSEKIIREKFKKVANHTSFEVWENIDYNHDNIHLAEELIQVYKVIEHTNKINKTDKVILVALKLMKEDNTLSIKEVLDQSLSSCNIKID